MGKCCACCCPCCRCKKKTKNLSVAKAPSVMSAISLFTVSAADDDKVISLENLPMSIEDIEAHLSDMKNMYAYAIETMKNFLGNTCYPYNTQPKQLYPYIMYLCDGLQAHEYIAIKEHIAEKQLSNIQVSLTIKDAKLVHPKITDFSRIFCKVWLGNKEKQMTTIKEGTSYLSWDETFVLDVTDYESDAIHVEVWASRPRLLERLGNFTQERLKENDLLAEEDGIFLVGEAFEYVKLLPCIGQNMLWSLKKGPRNVKGQLNLYLELNTRKAPDFMFQLYCNMTFIRLCYEKSVLKEEESHSLWRNWLEILPNTALTLIQQHAIQHGISPVEQSLCSWLVALSLKLRHEDRISFYFLKDLMEYLLMNVTEIEIGQAKDLFSKSISDFCTYSLVMLRNLHTNFDLQNVEMADELFYLLRSMSIVELRLCINYMNSFEVLGEECSEWYLQVIRNQKSEFQDDESIEKLSEVLKTTMKIYLRNQIILDDIFMRAWEIHYTSITYKELDKVVCVTIQPMIKHLIILLDDPIRKSEKSESLLMLQLYHNVKNLVNYVMNIVSTESILLRMDEYSSWFGKELVLEWFLLCDLYTSQFIQKAVLDDSMTKVNEKSFNGTSVPDVISIIDEMVVDVWIKLKWKDQFYTHGALVEAIKSCIVYYSRSILERLDMEKFFCQFEEFEISEKLCVAMSNMCALSDYILKISKKISKELEVTESELGFKLKPLLTIQSEMQIMTAAIFLLLFKRISKRVEKYIKKSITDPSDSATSAQLFLYVDTTLEVMYLNIKFEGFYILARYMWHVFVERLKSGMSFKKCFMTKKKKLHIYMAILQILQKMKIIFSNYGLTEYEMESKIYEELKQSLEAKLVVK